MSTNRVEGMKFVDIGGTVRGLLQATDSHMCMRCASNAMAIRSTHSSLTRHGRAEGIRSGPTVLRAGTNCATNINPASSCTDGSNKRLEFDTATNSADGFGGTLAGNRAYHPVAAAGRNTSAALGNQLLGGLTTAKTINCTDCHNNNLTGDGTLSTYLTANDWFTPRMPAL